GRCAVGLAALAQVFDCCIELLRRHPAGGKRLAGRSLLGHRQCQQQALDRDKAVASLLRDLLGLLENPRDLRRQVDLASAAALDPRLLAELGLDRTRDDLWLAARRAAQIGAEAFLVVEGDFEEMLRRQALVTAAQRQALGRLDESLRPLGIFVEFHDALTPMNRPRYPSLGSPATLPEPIWCSQVQRSTPGALSGDRSGDAVSGGGELAR